jgi:hypothetical protein
MNNPISLVELVEQWREQAREYDKRDRDATRNQQYVIAAQQGGLSCAFFRCANELEERLKARILP